MKKVRWGLLSTARINRRLIPAIRASRRAELVAVASRAEAHAKAYAAEWEIPKYFGGYQAMLDSGEVDVVYISLPNHLHAEWSINALRAGVNVLCEKPFAITLDEVDAMIAASRESGKALAEAFMYRHHPQTVTLGEWVRSGRLGEIVMVRSNFTFKLHEPGDVRLEPEMGGGALWDVGVYPVSFAQYVLGEAPQRVSGMQQLGETGVDETFVGNLEYASGALAQVACSFRTPYNLGAEVLGTQGRILIDRPFSGMDDGRQHLMYFDLDGNQQVVKVPSQELYLGEVEDMHDAILEGVPNYLTLEETRDHVRTVLALYEAARTGVPVVLAG
jgi:D-xylose 1-dehydrogenase (NADP+, D-xylono-1,5-lactone-forming)